jgi:hypothetical protein
MQIFLDLLSLSNRNNSLKSFAELASLKELEFLTDLFSFFTEFDSSVSRQTCRWWNDLLMKDTLLTKQIKKNTTLMHFFYENERLHKAALFGYFELVTWGRGKNFRIFPGWGGDIHDSDTDICSCAAEGGHLKILKWFRKTFVFDFDLYVGSSRICRGAAESGLLNILKWLRANGCDLDWEGHTTISAAEGNHLYILKWIRDKDAQSVYGPLSDTFSHFPGKGDTASWYHDICDRTRHLPQIQEYLHSLPDDDEKPCDCPRTRA